MCHAVRVRLPAMKKVTSAAIELSKLIDLAGTLDQLLGRDWLAVS